ncbi:hypothetical protein A0J61_01229 [Choanephora cucurbitarum]|uniref:Uncharacterized protein n=1 Tax=Choanephora cucurbitarum TaxID=101091 RepID=A0A1C7NP18_9FUNG|nr:hypothetical protein A0J61_01229 [Choanephora cucurbitarum]
MQYQQTSVNSFVVFILASRSVALDCMDKIMLISDMMEDNVLSETKVHDLVSDYVPDDETVFLT